MKLSPRLKKIAESINHCHIVADIGSDHAHLPIFLVKNQRTERAIASDINQGPIEISQKRIETHKLESRIETRKGSGLSVLEQNEVDTIVIAGMGGILIKDILEADLEVAQKTKMLILQPMTESDKLRKWLYSHSFEVIDEELVEDDNNNKHKLYEIIWTVFGKASDNEDDFMLIGKKIIEKKHPLAARLIDSKINELVKISEELKKKNTKLCTDRLNECNLLLEYYREARKWV